MKKTLIIVLCLFCGCGYTTRVGLNQGSLYLRPVVNAIEITAEDRAYSGYTSFPMLIEKKLTNSLADKIQIRGAYSLAADPEEALSLDCRIYDFKKEGLRYTDSDDVTEQRLRLYVHVSLFGQDDQPVKERKVVGETTYFLSGAYAVSESQAFTDLVEDTARRVVDAISEEW